MLDYEQRRDLESVLEPPAIVLVSKWEADLQKLDQLTSGKLPVKGSENEQQVQDLVETLYAEITEAYGRILSGSVAMLEPTFSASDMFAPKEKLGAYLLEYLERMQKQEVSHSHLSQHMGRSHHMLASSACELLVDNYPQLTEDLMPLRVALLTQTHIGALEEAMIACEDDFLAIYDLVAETVASEPEEDEVQDALEAIREHATLIAASVAEQIAGPIARTVYTPGLRAQPSEFKAELRQRISEYLCDSSREGIALEIDYSDLDYVEDEIDEFARVVAKSLQASLS